MLFCVAKILRFRQKNYMTVIFSLITIEILEHQLILLRSLYRQPLIVMIQSPKLAILQSLDAMDKVQMEEVLLYIKGILHQTERTGIDKKEAMKEIRQALRQSKKGLQLAA